VKRLFPYLRPYIPMIAASILLLFLQANADLALPDYMSRIVDEGIARGGPAAERSRYILSTGGVMLLLTLVVGLCTVAVGYISARFSAGFARDLRAGVFGRVMSFSAAEFDSFSTASLITRTTNDIGQLQMSAMMLVRMMFYAPIIGAGGVIRAMGKNSSMWWLIALAVGALILMVLAVYGTAVPKFKLIQKLTDRLNLVSREMLSGLMVIRAFNRDRHEQERFDTANRDLTETLLFVNRVMVVTMPLMMLLMNGLSLAIIQVGSHQVAAGSMQVGDMMAFIQYAMQIVFSFLMLSMLLIMLPRAAVSAERVAEVLAAEPSVTDPAAPESFPEPFEGTVEFRGVSFRYPGAEEDALHDVSFTARPGETVAFIGSTGSGKSTVANLILRFYDATAGEIRIGGVDIRNLSLQALREKIGFVPQKASLFSGTIRENLTLADESASEEAVAAAVSAAQAGEFIAERENGPDAEVSQGGANLSGGQRQRLSIARALVKRPPVYVFDDCFSALDYKTDAALRRALKTRTGRSTVIIVTQRVSTVIDADRIIVLDEGRIVGSGTHRELLERCRTYREIAGSQLAPEERV
jgi:ATP-binding cassette subfamily B multidrug efflux pump